MLDDDMFLLFWMYMHGIGSELDRYSDAFKLESWVHISIGGVCPALFAMFSSLRKNRFRLFLKASESNSWHDITQYNVGL